MRELLKIGCMALLAIALAPLSVQAAGVAELDTLYLIGGPDRDDGDFQDTAGLPDAEGWIGVRIGCQATAHWHIDTFNADSFGGEANRAMWCGAYFASCVTGVENPGYGNGWDESLAWAGPVSDTGQPTTVALTARLNHDTELAYDILYLERATASGYQIVDSWTGSNASGGVFTPLDVTLGFTVPAADYQDGDEIHLRWRFHSDSAWSDEDCCVDTAAGAAQLDDIHVTLTQAGYEYATVDDFQPGNAQSWFPVAPEGCCSFAQVWPLLDDLDPDHDNTTPQFAFINDGLVCPEYAATVGVSWTYGPDGYVTYDGDEYTGDEIWSPALDWEDETMTGAVLAFDVYNHTLDYGNFTTWELRFSTDDGTSWTDWRNHNYVYYNSDGRYARQEIDVTDLVEPGATTVQISLAHLTGFVSGPYETCPAPYFDNVSFRIYEDEDTDVPAARPTVRLDASPNPFNPRTVLSFTLPADGPAEVALFDMRGRKVRTLCNEVLEAGDHELVWNGNDDAGRQLTSGVYLARLSTDDGAVVRKLSIMK